MTFRYEEEFGEHALPDAYERLLLDALEGDPALFARSDEIEQAWRLLEPVLKDAEKSESKPLHYGAGCWGPKEADALLREDGRAWVYDCRSQE